MLQLSQLDVRNNSIAGTLPTSWGNLIQASSTMLAFVLGLISAKQCITLLFRKLTLQGLGYV